MQGSESVDIVPTDVVIVGAECTGLSAALAMADSGYEIALLTKGESIGRSGATMLACEPLSSCVMDSKSAHNVVGLSRGDERDSPDAFFEDVVTYGDYVNDQRLVDVVVSRAPTDALKLKEWGFAWDLGAVDRSPGHRFPRDYYGERPWGPQFLALGNRLVKRKSNIRVYEDTMALDLVTSESKITGVTAADLKSGVTFAFACRAVILAAGGAQNVFSDTTTGRELTGDGFAMAYRAGAELMDMEFVKFYTKIVWPPGAGYDPSALIQAFRHTSRWYNKLGQRFMERPGNDASAGDGDGWNSSSKIAIATEIINGRGGKHGIYYSIAHLPANLVDYEGEWGHLKGWRSEQTRYDYLPYIEMMKDGYALEINLAAHYNEGGLVIDEDCKSGVRGLFAAGEASAGVDGGQRVAGMALTTSYVQGIVAAEACARYLQKNPKEPIGSKGLARSLVEIKLLGSGPANGSSPAEIRRRVQRAADSGVWVVRTATSLKDALAEIPGLRRDLGRMTFQSPHLNFNPEFIEALQVRNLVDCLEMITTSALARTESRGEHFRSDFPLTDNDNWLRNVVVRLGPQGFAEAYTRPVELTRLKPPPGTSPHGENFSRIDSFDR